MTFAETIAGRLERHADRAPTRAAFTFLPDGELIEVRVDRASLHARATTIAAHLRDRDLHGERVLLLYDSGVEFTAALLGCFYSGTTAVPSAPPRRGRWAERLNAIVRDARPRAALFEASATPPDAQLHELLDTHGVELIATDLLPSSDGTRRQAPHTAIDDRVPALLQYTSGSTREPRGVVLSHTNLLDNLERIRRAFGQNENAIIVSWLPLHHDMGLIGTVLQPIYTGSHCVLMSPARFTEKPSRWLRAIHRYRATTSGGPDFAYALCTARVPEDERVALDLSSWTVAFNGAEPVRAATLRAFAQRFASNGFASHAFLPCYGLAEATLLVSGSQRTAGSAPIVGTFSRANLANQRVADPPRTDEDCRELVACGPADEGVLIVDPDTRTRCPDGCVGEIWLRNPSVGVGYWNRVTETAETFKARLRGSRRTCLRTGDLGFVQTRQLYVTGRRKDLIIVCGRNHDPQDIELSVERGLRERDTDIVTVAAIPWEDGTLGEGLALVIEIARRSGEQCAALAQRAREIVARDHEIATHLIAFVPRGSIPRTTSGKLRRGACRQALEAGTLRTLSEWRADAHAATDEPLAANRIHRIDQRITRLVTFVLGGTPPPTDPLIRHGLDSMKAAALSHHLTEVGFDVPITALLAGATLIDLQSNTPRSSDANQNHELAGRRQTAPSSARSELDGDAPLSYGQQALWFLQRVAPRNTTYHVAAAARVIGNVTTTQLDAALRSLCVRHPMLRARFRDNRGEPRQSLDHDVSTLLTSRVLAHESELPEAIADELSRPFTLTDATPARATLFYVPGQPPHLLLAAHHIVVDLWSLATLIADLGRLLSTSSAGPAHIADDVDRAACGYFAHVRSERAASSGNAITAPSSPSSSISTASSVWAYWEAVFRDPAAPLLPFRPASIVSSDAASQTGRYDEPSWRGVRVRAQIDADVAARIETIARVCDTTPFVVVCSAFQSWIRAEFAREDFFIGTPTHGRTADTARDVGHFVNMLPLRCRVGHDVGFDVLIARTRQLMLDALRHEVPFQLLVDRFAPQRASFDTPWLQAVFVWQESPRADLPELGAFASGAPGATLRLDGLTLESVAIDPRDVPFDLTLTMARLDRGFVATLDCRSARFDRNRTERLVASFSETLTRLTGDTQSLIQATAPAATSTPAPNVGAVELSPTIGALQGGLHSLFEAQAHRRPEAIAVCDEEATLTYGDLDARSNQLARHLRDLGAERESLIGIHLPRSIDLAIAILGVLKAGGAYLPIDEHTPPARVRRLLHDSGARLLITTRALDARLAAMLAEPGATRHVLVDEHQPAIDACSPDPLPRALAATSNQLAYCIYTSGSTGEPKGVLITHANVMRLFDTTDRLFRFTERDVWTLFHSPGFDFSVWEFWGALMYGGRVVMVPYLVSRDPHALANLLAREGVTVLNQTPSAFRQLIPDALAADQPRRFGCGS